MSSVTDSPRIIPRPEHPISRTDIDREALKVLYRLKDAGFSAYLVGGGVRDLYLGKRPKDFDISTDARPGQLKKLFRNSRVIGRRFRLVQVFFKGGKIIEVSTFRCRSEYDLNGTSEVLASNNTFGNPAEDAFRRDLTINALFYEIEQFTIIDHVNGVEDLDNRIVRMVGEPDRRITHDPVRMMRAIRHAARSGFTIEPKTWQAIVAHADMLAICPTSRLRDELVKDLTGGACAAWAELAMESGLFFTLFPFYRDKLGRDTDSRKLLLTLCAIIDRLGGKRLPEAMLLTMLLLPYALSELQLMTDRRGNAFFTFSRQLRDQLDNFLALLNIKRADKEAITGLLTNLPVFQKYADQQQWPKRLQRKSYFKQGLQFYRLYLEATGGPAVESVTLPQRPKRSAPVRKKRSHGHRTPALASKTKGGIFGFKR